MIATPKTIGRPTSNAAWRSTSRRADCAGIDDEAEIERAEAHEIRGQSKLLHRDERGEQSERNDRRRQQRGAQIPKEQEENRDDEQRAFGEVPEDGVRRSRDDLALVIEGANPDAFGEQRL